VSLCGSEFVKSILQDSGKLKQVAWGLDVGTGRGRTSIKSEFAFSIPLNFFYLLLFIFCFKEVYFELSFE